MPKWPLLRVNAKCNKTINVPRGYKRQENRRNTMRTHTHIKHGALNSSGRRQDKKMTRLYTKLDRVARGKANLLGFVGGI